MGQHDRPTAESGLPGLRGAEGVQAAVHRLGREAGAQAVGGRVGAWNVPGSDVLLDASGGLSHQEGLHTEGRHWRLDCSSAVASVACARSAG